MRNANFLSLEADSSQAISSSEFAEQLHSGLFSLDVFLTLSDAIQAVNEFHRNATL
jgi:hypothetical protein